MAVWATTVEASTTDRLPAGTVLPDLVGLVDQVGMVLLKAGAQVMVRPAVVVLVALAVTEDTSSERAQEVSTTETQSGHDTRSFAIAPQGDV